MAKLNSIRILKNALALLSLILLSCGHGQITQQRNEDSNSAIIISFRNDLEAFWKEAKGQAFDYQVELWDHYIEAPHQNFYDSVVWEKKYDKDWKVNKRRQLSMLLPKYPELMPEIQFNFETFPTTISNQLKAFIKIFPEPKINVPVYAALSPNFNGRGATLSGAGVTDQVILAFGIDMISIRKDQVNILFPHELFHIYHFQVAGITQDGQMDNGKLTLPLWEEGLATYVSGLVSPGHSDGELLMDLKLGDVPPSRIPELAKKFLGQAEEKAFDPLKPEIYRSWFNIGKYKVVSNLPNRCGYLLGLHVVRTLVKNYTLEEMTHWKVDEIHRQVVGALQHIAR